jgi:TorA maturation chaperone TorD
MKLTSRFVSLPKLAAAATLTASLWLAGGSPLHADEDCQKRIARIDHKLHEAAEHHGWNRLFANLRRRPLQNAYHIQLVLLGADPWSAPDFL